MADSWEDLEEEDIPKFNFELACSSAVIKQFVSRQPSPPRHKNATKTSGTSTSTNTKTNTDTQSSPASDKPMILVDLTTLTDGAIHNKFDKNACNDPDAKRVLTRKIEAEYSKYENDMTLIAQGIVRPCGQCVWRDALAALRDEVPGHFFAPIFPP
eukprot:CAMPEP_0198213426 /NCGR_PEP_ID=MMETSP1445-20131203/28860_1 /TAXON_ID=36898 /ORGANISM="Pyramimonas sp., Strain CCMP2087" /LENGTH=155 /DNA_ID=CAMNT_0043888067 /DNA_START=125 /DNA_END=592 /DNA_ORIENTATION=-